MDEFEMNIIVQVFNSTRFDNHDQHCEVKCMKTTIIVTAMLSVLLLQSCGSLSPKSDADKKDTQLQQLPDNALTGDNNNNLTTQNNFRTKPAEDEVLTTPEAEIIRELFQAGCLIDNFEMDRRKQNMRISCVKESVPVKPSI